MVAGLNMCFFVGYERHKSFLHADYGLVESESHWRHKTAYFILRHQGGNFNFTSASLEAFLNSFRKSNVHQRVLSETRANKNINILHVQPQIEPCCMINKPKQLVRFKACTSFISDAEERKKH